MKHLRKFVGSGLAVTLLAACSTGNGLFPSTRSPSAMSVAPLAAEQVLYSFQGPPDGQDPYGNLLVGSNGELFGTTNAGGSAPSGGDGTVFEVSTSGAEEVLHSFQGGNDGAGSEAGLIAGKGGVLYGVTDYGGGATACSNGCGTVFELTPAGSGYAEKVIYAFQAGADGAAPIAGLLIDKSGALYGTTFFGGGSTACTGNSYFPGGCGTVFKLTPSGSGFTETVLYSFRGGKGGAQPAGTLIADSKGALYGTTQFGGGATACNPSPSGTKGCGVVFKVTPSGAESVLYRFQGGANDGGRPRSALLATGNGGPFIGTTARGGPGSYGCGAYGCGTVFELTLSGGNYEERILHFFDANIGDGVWPYDQNGLYADAKGNLFGTASEGGTATCQCGAVFKLTSSGSTYTEKVIYSFQGDQDGVLPYASLIAKGGELYGTTFNGGSGSCSSGSTAGCGVVFKVSL